ncbi:MAG: hypothetical protein KGL99_10850 [Burkholderiales bacterium]|nr:hypothetical protein [Burkholderiales bacterium]
MTRLPTKRLATACWDFIVVKRARPQTAPLLDFLSLQHANKEIYAQVIHKSLWMSWGQFLHPHFVAKISKSRPKTALIVAAGGGNPAWFKNVSVHKLETPIRAFASSVRF